MSLHIISKSPYTHSALTNALPFITKDDSVLFIDDGVYATTQQNNPLAQLISNNCSVYALTDDISSRGLQDINKQVQLIEISDFVNLVFNTTKTVSWY